MTLMAIVHTNVVQTLICSAFVQLHLESLPECSSPPHMIKDDTRVGARMQWQAYHLVWAGG